MKSALVYFSRRDVMPLAQVRVMVPETPAESARGLAGHPTLRDGEGMLFDVRAIRRASGQSSGPMHFTTIGMLFPLDFLVVDGDEVVLVAERVHPGVRQALTAFADYVVEVPGGWARRHSVVRGSQVAISAG